MPKPRCEPACQAECSFLPDRKAETPMSILSANQVTKVYRMGGGDVPALAGVSLAIERGEFVAILGTSGSGKSTLLNLFGGLDHPTSGDIAFESTVLSSLNAKAMAQYRLKKIGMVF